MCLVVIHVILHLGDIEVVTGPFTGQKSLRTKPVSFIFYIKPFIFRKSHDLKFFIFKSRINLRLFSHFHVMLATFIFFKALLI